MELHHIYWLAGLLEGEGTFRYQYQRGRYASFHLAMGSRDEDVIAMVHERTGLGNVHVTDLKGRPFYHWKANGREAYAVMMMIFPMLGARRQQAIIEAVHAWRSVPVGNKWKTVCAKGHPLEGDNLYQWDLERGRRRCMTCRRENARKQEAKRGPRSRRGKDGAMPGSESERG